MTNVTYRVRDLLNGKTLIESRRGRDIVSYFTENFRPGKCDWRIQYTCDQISPMWSDVPPYVLRQWERKSLTTKFDR